MNLLNQLRAWFRRMRRRRAARREKGGLREFVYLDEVSVYSLIASRLGPVAAEFTETERASLKAEVYGTGSSMEVGSQVLRKSTVQTTFKELYEFEVNSLAIRPIDDSLKIPKVPDAKDLEGLKDILLADGWLVDPDDLSRGKLLEMEVQLEAEDMFRVTSVVSAVLEIIDSNPEMFGVEATTLAQAKAMGGILERLLAGLVPVRGLAVDYKVVKIQNKEWIIHRKLLNAISGIDTAYPLYVVGVAEQSLFWKDVRRVLFSKARFRVLCRLGENGVNNSWRPVKLAHILNMLKPGLGDQIDTLGSVVLASMVSAASTDQTADRERLIHDALARYAILLAAHYQQTITAHDLLDSGVFSQRQYESFGTLEERRKAFNEIAEFVKGRVNHDLDPLYVALYRTIALEEAGLDSSGQQSSMMIPATADSTISPEKRFLDSEFVAIYW